jgi:hypothetical protein
LSTRVHELAKELGLKSQELLDRIQQGGLGVKPSPLASLDAAMVARIREMMQGAPGPSPAEAAPPPAREPVPGPEVAPAPPAPRPVSPPRPPETPPIAATTAPSPLSPVDPVTAPSPPAPLRTVPPAPSASPTFASPPRPATPGPLAGRSSGLSGSPRSGPLSGHTPHRGDRPASVRPGGEGGTGYPEPRPNPATLPPLRRTDYISPTGTRHPVGGSGQAAPTPRRPEAAPPQGGEGGPRREGVGPRPTGRPLPPGAV